MDRPVTTKCPWIRANSPVFSPPPRCKKHDRVLTHFLRIICGLEKNMTCYKLTDFQVGVISFPTTTVLRIDCLSVEKWPMKYERILLGNVLLYLVKAAEAHLIYSVKHIVIISERGSRLFRPHLQGVFSAVHFSRCFCFKTCTELRCISY